VDRKLTSGAVPDNTGSQPIRIGANSFNKGQTIDGYFVGSTYDTRIWNRALLSQAMQQELSSVWSYPHDKDLVYDLLRKYDVKYIVIMAELGYRDFTTWEAQANLSLISHLQLKNTKKYLIHIIF
jgi:hypothetical protein